MVAYPLAGLLHGPPASKWLLPGVFPCPTTALALILMAFTAPIRLRGIHWMTFGLLLFWAIPFPLLIQIPKFGLFEDGIMVAAGAFAAVVRIADRRRSATPGREI
ncbi:MAG: hypothetical protein JW929_01065 [Anaerolineales bacterium]|nr:hypothetical protein [Anaerolineales bacterium]